MSSVRAGRVLGLPHGSQAGNQNRGSVHLHTYTERSRLGEGSKREQTRRQSQEQFYTWGTRWNRALEWRTLVTWKTGGEHEVLGHKYTVGHTAGLRCDTVERSRWGGGVLRPATQRQTKVNHTINSGHKNNWKHDLNRRDLTGTNVRLRLREGFIVQEGVLDLWWLK